MPSSCNLACTSVSSQTLARGSCAANASMRSNNVSSPIKSYSCSVALVPSGPTINSPLMSSLSLVICSGVSGRLQVPSVTLFTQFSKISASFISRPCCIFANSGRACSILSSMVCSTNSVLISSTNWSCSVMLAGCHDSK